MKEVLKRGLERGSEKGVLKEVLNNITVYVSGRNLVTQMRLYLELKEEEEGELARRGRRPPSYI